MLLSIYYGLCTRVCQFWVDQRTRTLRYWRTDSFTKETNSLCDATSYLQASFSSSSQPIEQIAMPCVLDKKHVRLGQSPAAYQTHDMRVGADSLHNVYLAKEIALTLLTRSWKHARKNIIDFYQYALRIFMVIRRVFALISVVFIVTCPTKIFPMVRTLCMLIRRALCIAAQRAKQQFKFFSQEKSR